MEESEGDSKTALNLYCQSRRLTTPDYLTTRDRGLWSAVCDLGNGKQYASHTRHARKKDAEQDAARVALDYLLDIQRAPSRTANPSASSHKQQDPISALNEWQQRRSLSPPHYEFEKVGANWICYCAVTQSDDCFKSNGHALKQEAKRSAATLTLQYLMVDDVPDSSRTAPPTFSSSGDNVYYHQSSYSSGESYDDEMSEADNSSEELDLVYHSNLETPGIYFNKLMMQNGRRPPVFTYDSGSYNTWSCTAIFWDSTIIFPGKFFSTKAEAKADASARALPYLFKVFQAENSLDRSTFNAVDCYDVTVVSRKSDIEGWIKSFITEPRSSKVFFDCEWPPRLFKGPISWIALASHNDCIIIPRNLFDCQALATLFRSPQIAKIGHGVQEDVRLLTALFSLSPISAKSICEITDFLPDHGWNGRQTPLRKLTQVFLGQGFDKDKHSSHSHDWHDGDLTEEERLHLANDVCVLCSLYKSVV